LLQILKSSKNVHLQVAQGLALFRTLSCFLVFVKLSYYVFTTVVLTFSHFLAGNVQASSAGKVRARCGQGAGKVGAPSGPQLAPLGTKHLCKNKWKHSVSASWSDLWKPRWRGNLHPSPTFFRMWRLWTPLGSSF